MASCNSFDPNVCCANTKRVQKYVEIKGQLGATDWFFYCKTYEYCSLNMFRAPLCCSIPQTGHITHSSTPDRRFVKPKRQVPQEAPICVTLELLTMGIMALETC